MVPYLAMVTDTGTNLGNAYYSFYNRFGNGEDAVMRSTLTGDLPLNQDNFILRLLGYTFGQTESLYAMLGGIFVTPFFFLSLFNHFRRFEVNAVKWFILVVWFFASIGMALFGAHDTVNVSQIYIILTPFFVGYGVSMVFLLIARSTETEYFFFVRNFVMLIIIVVSSGSFLFNLPGMVYRGIWLSARGVPHWPPYYPLALNEKLVEETNEKEIVVSDQPWAVAWYADRKSLWTPRRVNDFTEDLMPIIKKAQTDVQGFLVTPSSFAMESTERNSSGGVTDMVKQAGDFAPLMMEGQMLALSPRKNFFFLDQFYTGESTVAGTLGSLLSSKGIYGKRIPIVNVHMLYYTKTMK